MNWNFTGELLITQYLSRFNMYGEIEEREHVVGQEKIFPHTVFSFENGMQYFRNTAMAEPTTWVVGKDIRSVRIKEKRQARECVTINASDKFDWEGSPTKKDSHLLYSYSVRVYPPKDLDIDKAVSMVQNYVDACVGDITYEGEDE